MATAAIDGTATTVRWTRPVELVLAVILFCAVGYALVPFSYGDRRVLVPKGWPLDTIQQTLLFADRTQKLLTDPRGYYDTDILYPDHNQLRGLEPCLGFVLLGLPLHALHLKDVDVFEVSRWMIVVVSLVYAYLLLRSVGVDRAVSFAGATVCIAQPDLVNGFDRLQVVSIPFILPVIYHGLMVWRSRRLGHAFGLFVWAAMYPLCGMVNATIIVLAALFILPLLMRVGAAERRHQRLALVAGPIVAAAIVDFIVLAPWLLDRSDLKGYVSEAFLRVKHWNSMKVPLRLEVIPSFVTDRVGLGAVTAMVAAALLATRPIRVEGRMEQKRVAVPRQWYLTLVPIGMLAIAICYRSARLLPGTRLAFQVLCYATLLLYWRHQLRFSVSADRSGIRNILLIASAGLAVFLCLMSFGPVYISNPHLFSSHLLRVLLYLLPPVRSIREFERLWVFGILFLSIYVAVGLGAVLEDRSTTLRVGIAALVTAAAMSAPYRRAVEASSEIVPPRDVVVLGVHSSRTGPIYVHPRMEWNSDIGLWVIAIARQLHRPFVNGYLGIEPPWFRYAASVLHRFPDPQAMWLLQKWRVETVLSVRGDVEGDLPATVTRTFHGPEGSVYEIARLAEAPPHPSGDACVTPDAPAQVAGGLSDVMQIDDGSSVTVTVPDGFSVKRIEIAFSTSIVQQIPSSVDVFALDGEGHRPLNQQQSGKWIESLAADALVRRRSPVATVIVGAAQVRTFELQLRNTRNPPIERVTLCGEWRGRLP